MYLKAAATLIAGLLVMGAAPAAPPARPTPARAVPMDLAEEPASVMTGTVEERNATIQKALEDGRGSVREFSAQELPVEAAASFLKLQHKVDIEIRGEELLRQNITLHLFDADLSQVLEGIRWQIRLKNGEAAWTIDGGSLALVPLAELKRATETDAQRKQDAALRAAMSKPLPTGRLIAQEMPLPELLHTASLKMKINMVVDWKELEKLGFNKDWKVSVTVDAPTPESILTAILKQLNAKDGPAVSCEVWGGILRVSTRERLDREKPKEEGKPGGLP